ncbi:hypothetical protein CWRG_02457, partial [Chthonomonas calidirosea]
MFWHFRLRKTRCAFRYLAACSSAAAVCNICMLFTSKLAYNTVKLLCD